MSPKASAGPPRVMAYNNRGSCQYRGRGCAKEDTCTRFSGHGCALADYFEFLDDFDPERCRWEPGSKGCGCSTAGLDNLVPACGGTYRECVGYGNQENFGGMRTDPAKESGEHRVWPREAILPVQAYEVGGKVYKDYGEAERVAMEQAFLKWYENGADNVLYGHYEGSRIDAEPMLEWIKEHRHVLAKLLKTMA